MINLIRQVRYLKNALLEYGVVNKEREDKIMKDSRFLYLPLDDEDTVNGESGAVELIDSQQNSAARMIGSDKSNEMAFSDRITSAIQE